VELISLFMVARYVLAVISLVVMFALLFRLPSYDNSAKSLSNIGVSSTDSRGKPNQTPSSTVYGVFTHQSSADRFVVRRRLS